MQLTTNPLQLHILEAIWKPSMLWITEHVAEIPEKSYHWEKSGLNAWKWQGCCLQQIKWRLFFPAASSYPQSHVLWHHAFRQTLSVSLVLSLIYSFKQWQPHSKTMVRKLWVELTSIIMQIRGKKSPIVTHSSKPQPPPVLERSSE